jgi:glutamyl-tRNA reductase
MITLVGMNHRSAPLELRERACFPEDGLPETLARFKDRVGAPEALIIATCNRVELVARSADPAGTGRKIREFLAAERGFDAETLERHVYVYDGLEAARHVFAVACGLDSMVLGEPQILGQVKKAYAIAREAGATGPVLDRLLQHVLAAAKRVRTTTGISRHAVSVAYAAANLARGIFDDLHGRSALLLGAGKMTELAARHLVAQGVTDLAITNRTYARAAQLASTLGGVAIPWDEFPRALGRVDIVLTGTAAPQPVLSREQVKSALRARRGRPLFIVDIAVPRDVEPEVHDLDGVYLYDVDDLQGIVDAGLDERRRAAEEALGMLDAEVTAFDRWRQSVDLGPTIAAMRDRLHGLGRDEISRFSRRLSSLSPEQHAAVEELTRSIIQKVLHAPIVALKSSADRGEAAVRARLYREIFGLEERPHGEDRAAGEPEAPADGPLGPRRVIQGGKDA